MSADNRIDWKISVSFRYLGTSASALNQLKPLINHVVPEKEDLSPLFLCVLFKFYSCLTAPRLSSPK